MTGSGVFRRLNIRRFIAACARDCFQSIGPATPKRSVSSASADLGRRQRDGSCAGLVVEWRITPEPTGAALCAAPVGSNPPYGLWRAGAISIVGILACNHAESPMGSAMGGFTNCAMME